MLFKMLVSYKRKGKKRHYMIEEYDKDIKDAVKWGRETIKNFNDTLQEGEMPRKFHFVRVMKQDTKKDHTWRKQNLSTIIIGRGVSYDEYKCERCGVTGKRHGLGGDVVIDRAFKAKVYQRCDTALAKINQRRF